MMMTRRDPVASFALFAELLASGRHADAQPQAGPATPPASPPPPVFKHDLPNVTMDDWEVTVSYVDHTPGRVGAPHRHPGFVLAYVLEGAVVAKISGQGEEKTYTTGQMFYEQPGGRDARGLEKRQSDPTRAPSGDDLREERVNADDAGLELGRSTHGERRVGVAEVARDLGSSSTLEIALKVFQLRVVADTPKIRSSVPR
jgi:quercetin dioxygenase-like cupin family protein